MKIKKKNNKKYVPLFPWHLTFKFQSAIWIKVEFHFCLNTMVSFHLVQGNIMWMCFVSARMGTMSMYICVCVWSKAKRTEA